MSNSKRLSALQQWRIASELATQAELAFFDAALRSLEGAAPMPPDDQRDQAMALRSEATRLLHLALAQVDDLNQSAARLIDRRPRTVPSSGGE